MRAGHRDGLAAGHGDFAFQLFRLAAQVGHQRLKPRDVAFGARDARLVRA